MPNSSPRCGLPLIVFLVGIYFSKTPASATLRSDMNLRFAALRSKGLMT